MLNFKNVIQIFIICLLSISVYAYTDAYTIPDDISIYNVKYTAKLDDRKWENTIPFNMHVTPYLIVHKNGTISGFSGCNKFVAKISINMKTHKFKLGNVAVTQRACNNEGLNRLETEFLKSLKQVVRYDILVNQLTLKDKDNYPILVLSGIKL